jgi:hypothetical protein
MQLKVGLGTRYVSRASKNYRCAADCLGALLHVFVMPRRLVPLACRSVSWPPETAGPERALAGREWGHLGPMTDQSFDCDIAATLVAGHLGRPPLLGFDSTEDAGWPGTGLWKKGKASPGLIQALQSLPLPVFVASALRNVDDRRRNTKSLLETLRLPRVFQPASAPPKFLPVHFFTLLRQTPHPFTNFQQPFGCVQIRLRLVVISICNGRLI